MSPQGAPVKLPRLFSCFLLTLLPIQALAQVPVVSVASVDLARYSGKWFEIAQQRVDGTELLKLYAGSTTAGDRAPHQAPGVSLLNFVVNQDDF